MKKFGLWFAAGWTAIAVALTIYVSSNDKAEVVHFAAIDRDGYEDSPAQVRIYAPYSLKWEQAPQGGIILGYLFAALSWVAVWFVATDRHLGKRSGDAATEQKVVGFRSALGVAIPFVCVILSAVFLFSAYSSSLDMGSVVMTLEEYNKIKDEPGAIRNLFLK
jgi:hypothetical protein